MSVVFSCYPDLEDLFSDGGPLMNDIKSFVFLKVSQKCLIDIFFSNNF